MSAILSAFMESLLCARIDCALEREHPGGEGEMSWRGLKMWSTVSGEATLRR